MHKPSVCEQQIARILRTSKKEICELDHYLETLTGKAGALQSIADDNKRLTKERLLDLGVSPNAGAHEVYDALTSRIEADDLDLMKFIGHQGLGAKSASQKVVKFVKKNHAPIKGFFLKKAKAQEFLTNEPPRKIMKAMGYTRVDDLLLKEDLLEVYSALRFLEDQQWQNEVFFKQYESLTPDDFEERELEVRALNEKWAVAAEKFVQKKYHNVSHLKELGVVFVIPIFLGISGETLRLTSLLFHYLHEIRYYSDLFKNYFAKNHQTFASNLVSALRGDVIEERLTPAKLKKQRFLVIQRYLAKDDENDWRLFEPHINPEALHWQRAEEELTSINNLNFWKGIGWVGDYFKDETGVDILVSFDLVDTVMGLVKRRELVKYLYHQQEALWNEIFIRYFGVEKLEELSKRFIVKGWFEV